MEDKAPRERLEKTNRVWKLLGAEFDREYPRFMVEVHESLGGRLNVADDEVGAGPAGR